MTRKSAPLQLTKINAAKAERFDAEALGGSAEIANARKFCREVTMNKMKFVFAAAFFAVGVTASASAVPIGNIGTLDAGVQFESVRWVCNHYGRCWWVPNYRYRYVYPYRYRYVRPYRYRYGYRYYRGYRRW